MRAPETDVSTLGGASSSTEAASSKHELNFTPTFSSRDPLDLALSEIASPASRAMMASSPHIEFVELIQGLPKPLREKINNVLFNETAGLYCYMARDATHIIDRGISATLAKEVSTGKIINRDHSLKAGSTYNAVVKLLKQLNEFCSNNPHHQNASNHQRLIAYFEAQRRTLVIYLKKLSSSQQLRLKERCNIKLNEIPDVTLSQEQKDLIASLHAHYQQTPRRPTPRSVAAKSLLEKLGGSTMISPTRAAYTEVIETNRSRVPTLSPAPLSAHKIDSAATSSSSAAASVFSPSSTTAILGSPESFIKSRSLKMLVCDDQCPLNLIDEAPNAKRVRRENDAISNAIAEATQAGLELSFSEPEPLAKPFKSPLLFSSPGSRSSSVTFFKPRVLLMTRPSPNSSALPADASPPASTNSMTSSSADRATGAKRKAPSSPTCRTLF